MCISSFNNNEKEELPVLFIIRLSQATNPVVFIQSNLYENKTKDIVNCVYVYDIRRSHNMNYTNVYTTVKQQCQDDSVILGFVLISAEKLLIIFIRKLVQIVYKIYKEYWWILFWNLCLPVAVALTLALHCAFFLSLY